MILDFGFWILDFGYKILEWFAICPDSQSDNVKN